MKRPVIAITEDFCSERGNFLKPDLLKSLDQTGFDLIRLRYEVADFQKLQTSDVQGILIPGGIGDVPPEHYDEEPNHERVRMNADRAQFECRVIDHALQKNLPLLGICWGMQILNVHLGGTLHQHLPRDWPSPIEHEQKAPPHETTHEVQLEIGGLAHQLYGEDRLRVNSTHHQGVNRLGQDLVIEGRATDGLVEIVRMKNRDFVWAVQWHPERLDHDPTLSLFKAACLKVR